MGDLERYFLMAFGAALTAAGVILFAKKGVTGSNKLKLMGAEFETSAPSLVIVVLGVLLIGLPIYQGGQASEPLAELGYVDEDGGGLGFGGAPPEAELPFVDAAPSGAPGPAWRPLAVELLGMGYEQEYVEILQEIAPDPSALTMMDPYELAQIITEIYNSRAMPGDPPFQARADDAADVIAAASQMTGY